MQKAFLNKWLNHKPTLLYRESIIRYLFGGIRIMGRRPFDDGVKALRSRPLGMFFYNQRAIFLIIGCVYLIVTASLMGILGSTPEMRRILFILAGFWVTDFVITIALHKSFIEKLTTWVASPAEHGYPPLFNRYFIIDSILVLSIILLGKWWHLGLDSFAAFLFANTVVYSTAYIRGGSEIDREILTILVLQTFVVVILITGVVAERKDPLWFYGALEASPIVGMLVITVLSVSMISWLRSLEHELAQRRLGLLERFEKVLSKSSTQQAAGKDADKGAPQREEHSEQQFWQKVNEVLGNLCTLEYPFWYHSACLWFIEHHQDRGDVLIPGPRVNFDEAEDYQQGLSHPSHLFTTDGVKLLRSIKQHHEASVGSMFRKDVDAPGAFIALNRNGHRIGVLTLYGREDGPPLMEEEESFLWMLGSLIANTMEQWEGRYKELPLREMDGLFGCGTLDEVFPKAVKILKKYLDAEGCMVIFRPDPRQAAMKIRGVEGFSAQALKRINYTVSKGQTGKCADTGEPIRWDYVPSHVEKFDLDGLNVLEKALGTKIVSWMAVPIGPKEQNYGVIKVVNSTFRCGWFTESDQVLGESLAQRLHVMIEKFLRIKESIKQFEEHSKQIELAKEKALESAKQAQSQQENAEKAARQRRDDLMIITHQLQGPLSSIVSAITHMQQRKHRQIDAQDDRLKFIHALVEDALTLCFGTFSTFAKEAGRDIAFGAVADIDARAELEKLCTRLKRTCARGDLRFNFIVQAGFPTLKMDWSVFTSVFYSLVHNAMKYAEEDSQVIMECSFERSTGQPALKVKTVGEPIRPEEKEIIFEKYRRGSVIEKTGRHHGGVGLGLWVARELMRAVGGNITLELSREYPELSVFIVRIP